MFAGLIKFEESLKSIVIVAVTILILVSYVIAGQIEWYFVVGFVVYIALIFAATSFLAARSKYRVDKVKDERTARCSVLGARNGYLFALLAIGVASVISSAGLNPLGPTGTFGLMFGLIVAADFLSYVYYLKVN